MAEHPPTLIPGLTSVTFVTLLRCSCQNGADVASARDGTSGSPGGRRPHRRAGKVAGGLSVAAQPAGDGHPARPLARRAGRPVNRRGGHRATRRRHRAGTAVRLPRRQSGAHHRKQERRRLQQSRRRRLPDVAGRHPRVCQDRELRRRPQVRSRRIHRHADVPGLRVRPQRRSPLARAHSADHPGAVRVRRAQLPGPQVRPQQQVHRQPAVAR